MKRTNIYLTEQQHESVKVISNGLGITFSEMFRRIVDKYLEETPCRNVKNAGKNVQKNSAQLPAG